MAMVGSNGLPVFSTPKQMTRSFAHRRHDDLFGF